MVVWYVNRLWSYAVNWKQSYIGIDGGKNQIPKLHLQWTGNGKLTNDLSLHSSEVSILEHAEVLD